MITVTTEYMISTTANITYAINFINPEETTDITEMTDENLSDLLNGREVGSEGVIVLEKGFAEKFAQYKEILKYLLLNIRKISLPVTKGFFTIGRGAQNDPVIVCARRINYGYDHLFVLDACGTHDQAKKAWKDIILEINPTTGALQEIAKL